MKRYCIAVVTLLLLPCATLAQSEMCLYRDSAGATVQTNARNAVPTQYQKDAKCFPTKERSKVEKVISNPGNLAKPEEISLSGLVRTATLSTPLGPIELRWPRKTEELFGRTPERALADATQAVARALRGGSFDSQVQGFSVPIKTIFLDAELPAGQVPVNLITNCHPGWMTPPANIYVVGERAAQGCDGSKVPQSEADAHLAAILIHELGHSVEFQILGDSGFDNSRVRAEGFACWFEQYASDYSNVIPKGAMRRYYRGLARKAFARGLSSSFQGTAEDYAVAATMFDAVVARRGVAGLMDVYRTMREKRIDYPSAVKIVLGWDAQKLSQEAGRIASQG